MHGLTLAIILHIQLNKQSRFQFSDLKIPTRLDFPSNRFDILISGLSFRRILSSLFITLILLLEKRGLTHNTFRIVLILITRGYFTKAKTVSCRLIVARRHTGTDQNEKVYVNKAAFLQFNNYNRPTRQRGRNSHPMTFVCVTQEQYVSRLFVHLLFVHSYRKPTKGSSKYLIVIIG